MEIFPLLLYLWRWPQIWYPALRSFQQRYTGSIATWLLLPKTVQETEHRGEVFAGWLIPASVALAITWMVWHVSGGSEKSGCSYDDIHKCFPPNLISTMFIHGGIAAGIGGSLHLVMLREALDRARAAEARADRERERADKEQARAEKFATKQTVCARN